MEGNPSPKIIFLFSGKRKSGKDYVTEKLHSRLCHVGSTIIRLAGPIKYQFAKNHGVSYEELLTASDYKERYRKEMVDWSEAIRANDKGYFTRAALDMYNANTSSIWIVSDMRRVSDLTWFNEQFPGKSHTVRITASENTRKMRGYIFTTGIDDQGSECDLDGITQWDYVFNNDSNDDSDMNLFIEKLVQLSLAKPS